MKVRKPFIVAALVVVAGLVAAGGTIAYANRPRKPNGAEIAYLIQKHICRTEKCTFPEGSDWFTTKLGPKGLEVNADTKLPRSAAKIPAIYEKATGTIDGHVTGNLVMPEFKYFPTPPGEDGDYMRVQPVAGTLQQAKDDWDKEPVQNVRADLAILQESTAKKDQYLARELILTLAVERGTAKQLEQEILRGINPEEVEYPSLIKLMEQLKAKTSDPEKKKLLAANIKDFHRILDRLAELEAQGR